MAHGDSMARPTARSVTTDVSPERWESFTVATRDGVRLAGASSGPGPQADTAVVLCHGFLGSWRRPQNVALACSLARHHAVYVFDFRGHGLSEGMSTVGDREALDVHALVRLARERGARRVVTIGASMGAISVLREAAVFTDVDGIVSVSAPGRWAGHGRIARAAGLLVATSGGRRVARHAFRTRVYPKWTWMPPPVEMIRRVEAPVLIVHGCEDRFIPSAQARLLYAQARAPKRLWLVDGFGHAEVGYTDAFAGRLLEEVRGMLDDGAWGRRDEAFRQVSAGEPS